MTDCALFLSLATLANAAHDWVDSTLVLHLRLMRIINIVHNIEASVQVSLWNILQLLSGSDKWYKTDKENTDFEVSKIVWTFNVSPRGLALRWEQGKTAADTLLGAEEKYLENTDEVGRLEVKNFAEILCYWGSKLAHNVFANVAAEQD